MINRAVGAFEPEEMNTLGKRFNRLIWTEYLHSVKNEISDSSLLSKLKVRFEKKFRYDQKGVPKVWLPSDDIELVFSEAKKSVCFS